MISRNAEARLVERLLDEAILKVHGPNQDARYQRLAELVDASASSLYAWKNPSDARHIPTAALLQLGRLASHETWREVWDVYSSMAGFPLERSGGNGKGQA